MLSLRLLRPLRRPTPAIAPQPKAADTEEDVSPGCGWFDSSHDLHHGLCVRELDNPAALARELPLPVWIDLQLAVCTATHSAARP
jgi:hypothetical protein